MEEGISGHGSGGCGEENSRQLPQRANDKGVAMKWWIWASVAAVIAIGLVLLAGKDDMRRFRRMRRM